jgi:hypothetical protein
MSGTESFDRQNMAEKSFIEALIRCTAANIGLEKVILRAESNPTLPKPRLEFEFLQDSYIPTGRKIAKHSAAGEQIIVYERGEVDTPVMLYIIDNNDERIEKLSRELILMFPKGVADTYNNWVRIRPVLAEWSGFKAPTLGVAALRIEPVIERTFSVKISFTWRLTYERAAAYITDIRLGVNQE